jgi:hypothetical protein
MAGRLSVKDPKDPWHDTVLAEDPKSMNPPAFLCHDCGMFIVSGAIIGSDTAAVFGCDLRDATEVDDKAGYIKSVQFQYFLVPDPAHGEWMAVTFCADCARKRVEERMWGYLEYDAAELTYGEEEVPYDTAMARVIDRLKRRL